MKRLISIFTVIVLILALAACGSPDMASSTEAQIASQAEKLDATANIYALKGPTGMGLVPLMKKADNGKAGLKYNFSIVSSNDEIVAKIANGEADIAAVATNLASNLYKRTSGGITVLAVNTLGVLCLVTKGEEITDISSLKGKTIYSTGQGANPEYILNYLLTKNGLTPGEDVTVSFLSQNEELVTTVASNEKAIVIAPQPVATTITVKDTAARLVMNLTDEWDKVCDTKLVMGCIVVRNDYLEKNKEAVELFLDEYKKSVESVNTDTESAAALCESYGITASAAIAKKAIPYCNIVFEKGSTMKTDLSAYLKIMFGYSPASVGGALPDDGFYYGTD